MDLNQLYGGYVGNMKDTLEHKIVKAQTIDHNNNMYVNNRDNPNWPLAINNVKKNKPKFVSNKQIRGISYGSRRSQ